MAPKKAAASAGGAKKAAPQHASYQDMIKEAVISLKDRAGSSRQAIKKYVLANNNLDGVSDNAFSTHFNHALQKGSESGVFARPKGTSGPVKLAAPAKAADKPAAKVTKAKSATAKPATKKAPAKKTTATKPAAKSAPAKKTTTKTKANTSKARKTPTTAPAVEDKAPVVLGKTKSGRVTKSKAPQPAVSAKPAKKAPVKKTTTKKATPKKA